MSLNKRLFVTPVLLTLTLCLGMTAVQTTPALAHGGHAGKEVVFVEEREALRAMLPEGAKIAKRKEVLTDAAADQAEQEWGVELDRDVYTYYLARDPKNGATVGMAMVTDLYYRHGEARVALGLDASDRITKAAILSINSKYILDLERSIGKGYLPTLDGKSIDDLKHTLNGVADDDWAAKEVLAQLRNMIAVLRTLRQDG